jgi:hypothetical protein
MGLELDKKNWLDIQKQYTNPNDFIISVINCTVINIKPYANGYGLYVDYDKIYNEKLVDDA